MLSRKTLGVAGAAILGSMALLVTNTANATINLEDGMGTVKYAKETLVTELMRDGVKYYVVTNGSNAIDMTGELGFDPGSTDIFVRFDLTNMVFAGAASLGDASLTGATTAHVAGGAVTASKNDNWVVFRANSPTVDDEVVTLAPTALGVMPDQPGSVKIRVYLEVTDALAGNDDDFRMKEVMNAVSVTSGVKATVEAGMNVADVAENFEKFVTGITVGDTTVGEVGTLTIAPAANTLNAADSAQVTAVNVYADTGTSITVTGDFSSAAGQHHQSGDSCVTAADAGGADNLGPNTTGMATLTLATAVAAGGTSVCLLETEDKQIPATPYMVTVKFAKAAPTNPFGAPDFMDELGRFTRNGTTVQIPYMTTYAGYNQRIVLSNRGTTDATYVISFRPEMGVTAMAKDMATGTLMAGSTVTYKSTDLVMLEGGARTAATINLVAEPQNIDVTTVTVNMETRGTDTVVHHSGMM